MIKCSKTECSLYTKDGSRRLGGPYPFSEHGGEEGARAAAHKREGQVMHFKRMKKSLTDAVDDFGAPAVLEYVIKALGDDCEDVVLMNAAGVLGVDGFDIEKARRKKVRRVTIEDEDDDDDGDEEERTTTTKKKTTPPGPEVEEEAPAREGGEPAPKPGGEEGGAPAPKAGEGEGGLPEGWTPESLAKYWESLGGTVESCVAKAPDTVKDKQGFCTRLQAKVGAAGGGKEEGAGEEKPAPPVEKSADEVLGLLAELMVEKAFKRVGAPGGAKYKGATGWDDPRSWLKAGAPDEIRKKAWEGMGGTVTGCIAKVKGKVDDPGAFCASLKDRVTGTTMWRGKKGKEEEAVIGKSAGDLELLDGLLYREDIEIDWDDWDSVEKSMPEGEIVIIDEDGILEEIEKSEADVPTFLGVIRESHRRRADVAIGGLVEEMRGELEVE